MSQPKRLASFNYIGIQRYFVTMCTAHRHRTFVTAAVVDRILCTLRQTAHEEDFELLAFCFMPDHVHLLVEGQHEVADFRRFMKVARQRSSHALTAACKLTLWQRGYFEHVLRDEDRTEAVVRYVLGNPVRAGLVRQIEEYPFLGSDVWPIGALLESFRG